jgi:RNA polymerase sigma-70 factor (ECF subfamily)
LLEDILIKKCIANDRTAQYELYNQYAKQMYNVCMRMMSDADKASDMLQEGFLEVFGKIQQYSGQGSLGGWIRKLMITTCLDGLRREKRQQLIFSESIPEHFDEVEIPNDINIDLVIQVVESLPTGYRMIFSLYALEGYDHEEIGQILGISEQTSKSQYHRAKLKIKEQIENLNLKDKIYGTE